MITQQYTGDVTLSQCQTIVCTTNCVGVMGKGVALAVKQRWPEVETPYREICRLGHHVVGKVDLIPTHDTRLILMFPTKRHWRYPSQLNWVEWGLQCIVSEYPFGLLKPVTSLAVPPLGCGNGGLDYWRDVKPMIEHYLDPLPLEIHLFVPEN